MITDSLTPRTVATRQETLCNLRLLASISLSHFKSKNFHSNICRAMNGVDVRYKFNPHSRPLNWIHRCAVRQKARCPLQCFHHLNCGSESQTTNLVKWSSSKQSFQILEMHLRSKLQIANPLFVIGRGRNPSNQFVALIRNDKNCFAHVLSLPYGLLMLASQRLDMLLVRNPDCTQNRGDRSNSLHPGRPFPFIKGEMLADHPARDTHSSDSETPANEFFPLVHAVSFQKGIVA